MFNDSGACEESCGCLPGKDWGLGYTYTCRYTTHYPRTVYVCSVPPPCPFLALLSFSLLSPILSPPPFTLPPLPPPLASPHTFFSLPHPTSSSPPHLCSPPPFSPPYPPPSHHLPPLLALSLPQAEYSTDLLSKAEVVIDSCTIISDASAPHKLFVHIPMSVFKFYLHRILLASVRVRDDPVHSIMLFFQKTEVREEGCPRWCVCVC